MTDRTDFIVDHDLSNAIIWAVWHGDAEAYIEIFKADFPTADLAEKAARVHARAYDLGVADTRAIEITRARDQVRRELWAALGIEGSRT